MVDKKLSPHSPEAIVDYLNRHRENVIETLKIINESGDTSDTRIGEVSSYFTNLIICNNLTLPEEMDPEVKIAFERVRGKIRKTVNLNELQKDELIEHGLKADKMDIFQNRSTLVRIRDKAKKIEKVWKKEQSKKIANPINVNYIQIDLDWMAENMRRYKFTIDQVRRSNRHLSDEFFSYLSEELSKKGIPQSSLQN